MKEKSFISKKAKSGKGDPQFSSSPLIKGELKADWNRTRKTELKPLSDILPSILDKLKISDKLKEQKVLLIWNKIVGDKIKYHTKPFKIENNILTVLVDNSTWMQELTFLKTEIIKKLNEAIGADVVKDIKFRLKSKS